MLQLQSQSIYGSVSRWVIVAIIIVALLLVTWAMRGILLLILASIILVVMFSLPIRFLVRLGINRRTATILSVIFFIFVVAVLSALTLPELIEQSYLLAAVIIPQGVQALVDRWASGDIQQQFPILQNITSQDIQNVLDTFGAQIVGSIGQIGSSVLPLVGGVADTFLSILVIVFLSLYILADPSGYQEGMIRLFPLWYRGRVREILGRLDLTLRGWLKATLFSMVFVGLATWIGLALIGIQQSAALGVLAGILSFIPNFGPIIALIPSIAVGMIQTPQHITWIIVVIYGVSFIQTQILIPLLVAGSIRLPAVLVLIGQILGGALLGFWGLMLAVPLTAIIVVVVQEVYIRDVLGDKSVATVEDVRDDESLAADNAVEGKLVSENA